MLKTAKNLREITSTAMDMFTMRYPGFVYGRGLPEDMTPVFCFHGVEQEPLEAMLRFLSENGYATLHADEYCDVLLARMQAPRRSVVLTFDDGWGSLWSVGFPLFKKYRARVIVFLAAGRIEHRTCYRPNLEDLEAGQCSAEEVLRRDNSEQPLLTWEEIVKMHESGLVDFQSHSYSHSLVYRSPRIVDFVNPSLLEAYNLLEMPYPSPERRAGTRPSIHLGEPLYETAPRLSDTRRLLVDQSVADGCAAYVREHGGPRFFEARNWRDRLDGMVKKLLPESREWRLEEIEEQARAIRFELEASKRLIEKMLRGKEVRHLCYPWHVAGTLAVAQSREVGYASNFWGKIDGRFYTSAPADPFRIARVGGDFFFRLPGKGRVGLLPIIMRKVVRRAREGSPYLTH